VGGPGTVVKAYVSGREAALNICGDLCVEEVGKTRCKDHPEWRFLRDARRIPPEESRRTFQEDQKRYHDDCGRRDSGRCARCNLWS
jgi:hypothetical protein